MTLQEAIKDLASKVKSADEVAEFLEREGIKGNINRQYTCPLARYFSKKLSFTCYVDTTFIYSKMGYEKEKLPIVLKGFIYNFDERMYPELIK